ncbi:hypothetical protein L1987_31165 [Smallanthus sonchifolius]|uniref:Uncharacterized protein n=1 Tax=Smallanthus sonchifolius TaxID=185202 RepID=A0ACB9I4L9_9ASTR|nr:hypothetical protein L1987_31165 [Smallanthus sonchifolius]
MEDEGKIAQVKGKRPSSASASAKRAQVIQKRIAAAAPPCVDYALHLEGDRIVRKPLIFGHLKIPGTASKVKVGFSFPPDFDFKDNPAYVAAVASGAKVEVRGRFWVAKPMENL